MQSAYHNLPTLIGIMQADGESYRAFDVSFDLSDTLCNICMDIAQAYPKKSGLSSYRRTAALYKNSKIVIKDFFAFENDASSDGQKNTIVLSLMSYEKPILQNASEGLLFLLGDLGTLSVSGASLFAVETIPGLNSRGITTCIAFL